MRSQPRTSRRLLSALVAAAFAAHCATNPVTGKSELSLVSVDEEKEQGRMAYGPTIQQSNGKVDDPPLQGYVNEVGLGLAKVSHAPDYEYVYTVVNANYDNAFALPGGKICITRGLLARMTNEDQLAGVLGHETGHVCARHGAAGQTRQMITQGVMGVGGAVLGATGVRGGAYILQAAGVGSQLILQRYSRDQERQADELGMLYMARAGYNPGGFVEAMEILKAGHEQEPSKFDAMFQSHPLTSERIDTSKHRLAELYAQEGSRAFKDARFKEVTRQLKSEVPAFKLADEAEKALANRDDKTAEAKLAEASRLAPHQAILPALRSLALLHLTDDKDALIQARQAQKLDPDLYHANLVAGLAQFKERSWEGAIADLGKAEQAVGPQLVTSYLIGRSHEVLGHREQAAERYAFVVKNAEQQDDNVAYCYRKLNEWGYVKGQ